VCAGCQWGNVRGRTCARQNLCGAEPVETQRLRSEDTLRTGDKWRAVVNTVMSLQVP
jgi:hypothetical protein